MLYHYRCTKKNNPRQVKAGRTDCGKRRTLDHKVHDLACKHCGHPMKLDPAVKRWNKKQLCRCDGAHYPHMKGSLMLCEHFDASGFSDEELEELRRVPR